MLGQWAVVPERKDRGEFNMGRDAAAEKVRVDKVTIDVFPHPSRSALSLYHSPLLHNLLFSLYSPKTQRE